MITMTLSNTEWSRAAIVEGWLDQESQEVAEEAADAEIAYIINNISKELGRGWEYKAGTFTGPYLGGNHNAVQDIMRLTGLASDYAVENIDEIRIEAKN